jgi:ribosomal protein L11 methyltransferase
MEYTELDIRLKDPNPFSEIIIARLNDIDFETFLEDENGVKCYIKSESFNEDNIKSIIDVVSQQTSLQYSIKKIPQKNWNAEWEKNFTPVVINSRCVIRADFHSPCKDIEEEIIINPKMSFGTGHHETTFLMINHLYSINLIDKNVLDMGSGTGVLSIASSKLGAKNVTGIDIDKWAYENSIENTRLNNIDNINFILGDVDSLDDLIFDIILANINRNIILRDLPVYHQSLSIDGELLISGFLHEDINMILSKAKKLGFKLINKKNKNQWYMLHLRR